MALFDENKELLPGVPMYTEKNATLTGEWQSPKDYLFMKRIVSSHARKCGYGRNPEFSKNMYRFSYAHQKECFPLGRAKTYDQRYTLSGAEGKYDENRHGEYTFDGLKLTVDDDGEYCYFQPTVATDGRRFDSPCLERVVEETRLDEVETYLGNLEKIGWKQIYRHQMEENICWELEKDGQLLAVTFFCYRSWGNWGKVQFVLDTVSVPVGSFGGNNTEPDSALPMEICQFGLYYDQMIQGTTCDCGMLYILRLPDNSLFLIDGGMYEQATEAACGEIMRVLHKMTGTNEGDKLTISGWFATHPHEDHMDVVSKLIRFHHDEMDLQRIVFNFPDPDQYVCVPPVYFMLSRLNKYYPDAKYLKPHTGMAFTVAGVEFSFVSTHEDEMGIDGREHFSTNDVNEASTVMKVTSPAGASFIITGDIDCGAESSILRNFTEKTLSANLVQVSHHLINDLHYLYGVINPDYALVPSFSKWTDATKSGAWQSLNRQIPREKWCIAGEGTTIWQETNGRFKKIAEYPTVGGKFDNSQL